MKLSWSSSAVAEFADHAARREAAVVGAQLRHRDRPVTAVASVKVISQLHGVVERRRTVTHPQQDSSVSSRASSVAPSR